jgi:hypothetical protein
MLEGESVDHVPTHLKHGQQQSAHLIKSCVNHGAAIPAP